MKINDQKGLTLIEMLVSIALLMLFLTVLFNMLSSMRNINTAAETNYTAQEDAQIIIQNIQTAVRYADSLTIYINKPESFNGGKAYIYLSNGIIMKNIGSIDNEAPIISFPQGYASDLCFKISSPKSIEVTVKIYRNNKQVYDLSANIYINNLAANNIEGALEGQAIEYTLPAKT